jgi:hypothetical protein
MFEPSHPGSYPVDPLDNQEQNREHGDPDENGNGVHVHHY